MVRLARISCSLYFILVHCLCLVYAPFPWYERIDQNDHRSAMIQCDGATPSWPLPVNFDYHSVQLLCAKHRFGGLLKGSFQRRAPGNAGGWCAFHLNDAGVVFDTEEAPPALVDQRIQLFCLSRCRCHRNRADGFEKPVGAREITLHRSLYPDALIFVMDLISGLHRQVSLLESTPNPASTSRGVDVIAVTLMRFNDFIYRDMRGSFQRYFIAPLAGEPIRCRPLVPPVELESVFSNRLVQQVCAARMYGGIRNQNAGGICARPLGSARLEVQFLQELSSPRFYPTTYPIGISVRAWCSYACYCNNPEDEAESSASYMGVTTNPSDQSFQTTLPWLGGSSLDLSNGGLQIGAVVMMPQGSSGQHGSQYKLIPEPYPLDKLPWPTEPWLPPPAGYVKPPPLRDDLANPKYRTRMISNPELGANTYTTETCYGTCQGPCGSECSCMVTREDSGSWYVDDPVFPSFLARCALSVVAGSLLGKRNDQNVLGCVCNSTYISLSCCDSLDGMVWEDRHLRLGRLDVDSTEV